MERRIELDDHPVLCTLQPIRLYVLPQRHQDRRPALDLHPEQLGQPTLQRVLDRPVVQKQVNAALYLGVARALHLKAVRVGKVDGAAPLDQVALRKNFGIPLQLDDDAAHKGGKLALGGFFPARVGRVEKAAFDLERPRWDAVAAFAGCDHLVRPRLARGEIRHKDAKRALHLRASRHQRMKKDIKNQAHLHGAAEKFLGIEALAHDGCIEALFKVDKALVHGRLGDVRLNLRRQRALDGGALPEWTSVKRNEKEKKRTLRGEAAPGTAGA